MPAGNGVAAAVLLKLGHLLGEQRYIDAAEHTVRAALQALERYPEGHSTLLLALEELSSPPQLVVVRGCRKRAPRNGSELETVGYNPHRLAFCNPELMSTDLSGLLAERTAAAEPPSPTSATACSAAPRSYTSLHALAVILKKKKKNFIRKPYWGVRATGALTSPNWPAPPTINRR